MKKKKSSKNNQNKIYRKRKRESIKKSQMAKMRAKYKSSPRHEEVKRADRIRKKSRARTLNFDANNEVPRFCSKVSVFKERMNSGPYYICVVCNRCLYRRSVGLFNRNKFYAISDDVFSLFRHLMVTFTYARIAERS